MKVADVSRSRKEKLSRKFCRRHGRRNARDFFRGSIYDKKFGALRGVRAMRRIAVSNMVALASLQFESFPVLNIDVQRSVEAQQHVSFGAPVIGFVTG
jgi:hypothetical protein